LRGLSAIDELLVIFVLLSHFWPTVTTSGLCHSKSIYLSVWLSVTFADCGQTPQLIKLISGVWATPLLD